MIHDCCNCKYSKNMKCKHKQAKKYTIEQLHQFVKEGVYNDIQL